MSARAFGGHSFNFDAQLGHDLADWAQLVEYYRDDGVADDLMALSLRLARNPCGPLRRSERCPDRELRKLVSQVPSLGQLRLRRL